MKKIIKYITLIILIAIVLSAIIYFKSLTKQYYNDTFINGNTAGNLYNQGLFCEDENSVYFANPLDDNRLYCLSKDTQKVHKLNNDTASYINVDDHYIYYTRAGGGSESSFSFLNVNTHSLCRIRKDGKGDVVVLDEAPALYASLVGNYIYYLHYDKETATTLYRINIDGSNKEQLSKNPYFTCSTDGQYIYYNGIEEDHNVYQYDTASHTQSLLYEGNCYMPVVDGNDIYYLDCTNDYHLTNYNLSTNIKTELIKERVDCFNLYNGIIYYQTNGKNPSLCSMNLTDNKQQVIHSGIYTTINAANNQLYFKDFQSNVMYQYSIATETIKVFNPQ